MPPSSRTSSGASSKTHVREGGFALIHGDPGTGKSVVLRLLAERLGRLPDVTVAVLNHPQSNLADFYRETGRAVRRRAQTAQPLGRLQEPARTLDRPPRRHPAAPGAAHRRSPGDEPQRTLSELRLLCPAPDSTRDRC